MAGKNDPSPFFFFFSFSFILSLFRFSATMLKGDRRYSLIYSTDSSFLQSLN